MDQLLDGQVPEWGGAPEPIAIVGIGCRFPGGADSPARFWELLRDGIDAIGEMPPGRFDIDAYHSPVPGSPGKVATRYGGFLREIDRFDAAFFGIAPREAAQMDPQQRLLLETAWEALEDAGLSRERIVGSPTGVFVGLWLNDYEACLYGATDEVELYSTTGGGRYPAAGRLSFAFDLRGPSLTVDTACSSSLVAVHLAVQSLRRGETSLALAGGVNVILQPQISVAYSRSGMLAPDGRCKFGDAQANGYVRSEGCGVVVLKRLSAALAEGDPIYAVIRGSAVNNDGQGSGLLVQPSIDGQAAMLRAAYADARVVPGAVGYVEAHGTGTLAGDPVELQALGTVLGEGRPAGRPCFVGSVKTNIGHTEGAAGIAGLIKAALALKHRAVPGNLHFAAPSPRIPWDRLPVAIPTSLMSWDARDSQRYAGVSSFGITGTNAHIVLQEPPPSPMPAQIAAGRPQLLLLSAHTPAALTDVSRTVRAHAADNDLALDDLCYTAGARRTHLPERLALVAGDRDELFAGLDTFLKGVPHSGLHTGRATGEAPRAVFVFPGQGSQWVGMARELLATEPVFREALECCDAAIRAEAGWSVLAELTAAPGADHLEAIDIVQPTLFAVQVALAALWRSWGVVPGAVVGHSMGEVAAAHVAGALDLADATAVICRRSRLLRRVRGQGAMAVVELSIEEARAALAGNEHRLAVAVSNGPRSTVLSGDPVALDMVLRRLQDADVFCRPVKVDVASHSPQMDPLLDDLREALRDLAPQPTTVPMYSTVMAAPADGRMLDAAYWARNLRQPVLFADAIAQVLRDCTAAFVEISPHPILLPALQQAMQHVGTTGMALPSLRRGEPERATLLASLGALATRGQAVNWRALAPAGRPVHLPAYPWQRERFWFDDVLPTGGRTAARAGGHPLLGVPFAPAGQAGARYWESGLDLRRDPLLGDHRVDGAAIAPATAYAELAQAAAAEMLGTEAFALEELAFREALVLSAEQGRPIQVAATPHDAGLAIEIYGGDASNGAGAWSLQATARARRLVPAHAAPTGDLAAIRARCGAIATADEHYAAMAARGLEYGAAFRTVAQVCRGEGEVFADLQPDGEADVHGYNWRIRLLDGALQLAVAALPPDTPGTYVPVRADAWRVYARPVPGQSLHGHAVARAVAGEADGPFAYDVRLLNDAGSVLVEISSLRLRRMGQSPEATLAGWLHELHWQPQERPRREDRATGAWIVFAADELGHGVAAELRARGGRSIVVSPGEASRQLGPDHISLAPANPDDLAGLLARVIAGDAPPRGVVHAWSPAVVTTATPEAAVELGAWSVAALARALARTDWEAPPHLWLATRCAQPAGDGCVDAAQALTWGMGRVIATEHPQFRCTLVDLGRDDGAAALCDEILAGTDEPQVALRGSARYVARLEPRAPDAEIGPAACRPALPAEPYRLEVARPGLLDSLHPRPASRRAPGPGEVELRVSAAGLNFIDVMKAMGIYLGFDPRLDVALGAECAGTVVGVGPGVANLAPGDTVLAFTPSFRDTSCLAAYVTVPAELVAPRPAHLSDGEAAGQPIAYMTAYYALHELARMRRGDRVLIHSAAGGVGLAAVELARRAGAEVFATAGSDDKRAYLRDLGVGHVYDSRTLTFADEVLADTGGRGVDIVLNSLAGEAIAASLRALAPRGRFVEIGKRDIYANRAIGLEPFRKNLAFFALDLARMVEEDRRDVAALFQTVVRLLEARELTPLPVATYPIGAASEVFRTMAQGRHIGKLVVRLAGEPVDLFTGGLVIRSDASYLITGGLGALGLETARWLASRGARHLALLGRSGPAPTAREAIERLELSGVRVLVLRGDVASAEDVVAALAAIDAALPPLRGVFHAAGLLADATVLELDRDRLDAALAPKVGGAWNLHRLTLALPLDCFVLFSSVAALLGLPGQANYAAANAYLDALAHQRRDMGLPALSINWGPWAGIGLAAAGSNRGARLDDQGLASVEPTRGLAALEHLLHQDATQVAVMRLDVERWAGAHPTAAAVPFLESFRAASTAVPATPGLRESLLAITPDRRAAVLAGFVREQLAQVLRMAPDRLDTSTPLKSLGLDSLMALELRNRLEAGCGIGLSATLVWNYPTIDALVEHLAARLEISTEPGAAPLVSGPTIVNDELAGLTQDEVVSLLDDELAAIAELLGTR